MIVRTLTSRRLTDGDKRLSAVMLDALDLLGEWGRHRIRALAVLDELVSDALEELGSCNDQAGLFEGICPVATRALGSRSVLISRVTEETWSAWRGYSHDARGRSQEWANAEEIPLMGLSVEIDVIRAGRAVILDAGSQGGADLPSPFRRMTESAPYILAPVFVGPDAVALLYLPQLSRSAVSPSEYVERVQRFASGLGLILERELLHDRFRAQRRTIRATTGSMERIMSSLDTGVDLVRLAGRTQTDAVSAIELPLNELTSTWDKTLTTRESDVVRLLVLGHDNTAIATQLAVTASTVKSHVRHAMRKLGAVNRTELIARYHGGTDDQGWRSGHRQT